MVDHSMMRLGRRPARHDARVPRLARYLTSFPKAPDLVDYTGKLTALGMMANDRLGDCTCAAVGHAIQVWSSQVGAEVTISDGDVVALYERFGYNPANPNSDQGAVISDVLASWQKNPVAGHSIDGSTSIDPSNVEEVLAGVYLFGGVDIGVDLPMSAQSQEVWDVPPGGPVGPGQPGSWGGHSIFVPKAQRGKTLTCITWGALKEMTWEFFAAYCDEAYAMLSPDWRGAEGFDYSQLSQDMQALDLGQGLPRNFTLTDAQVWMIQDALSSKLDGASEDDGVLGDTTATQKQWQDLADFFGLPRIRR